MNKWKTQVDGVASPTDLYLILEHKDYNTILVVSHMAAIQFLQIKIIMQYIHTEGGIFSIKEVIRGGDKDGIRENIVGEDPPPYVDVK